MAGGGFLPGLMQSADSILNSGMNIADKVMMLREKVKNSKSTRELMKARTALLKAEAEAKRAGIAVAGQQSAKNQELTRWLVLGTAGVASALALTGG